MVLSESVTKPRGDRTNSKSPHKSWEHQEFLNMIKAEIDRDCELCKGLEDPTDFCSNAAVQKGLGRRFNINKDSQVTSR